MKYLQYSNLKVTTPQENHLLLNIPSPIIHEIDESSPLLRIGRFDHFNVPGINYSPKSISEKQHYLKENLKKNNLEIMVVLVGTCPTTSNITRAKHTYIADEIVWGQEFKPCVQKNKHGFSIDLNLFHQMTPCEPRI